MKTIKDTNGNAWEVGYVYTRQKFPGFQTRDAARAQIPPGYAQINLSPVGMGGNHSGHTLPETLLKSVLVGRDRLKIS